MKKILVVDDDPEIIELLKGRLEKNNYKVLSASEGVEGLAKAKAENPDLIILDIAMPVMDGHTFIQDLKMSNELERFPIIILTGRDQVKDMFKKEEIACFMTKPFDVNKLLKKINELTEK